VLKGHTATASGATAGAGRGPSRRDVPSANRTGRSRARPRRGCGRFSPVGSSPSAASRRCC